MVANQSKTYTFPAQSFPYKLSERREETFGLFRLLRDLDFWPCWETWPFLKESNSLTTTEFQKVTGVKESTEINISVYSFPTIHESNDSLKQKNSLASDRLTVGFLAFAFRGAQCRKRKILARKAHTSLWHLLQTFGCSRSKITEFK